MNDFSTDPLASLGTTIPYTSGLGIAMLLGSVIITVISYKVCISWFGDASPGYLACSVWLLGICVANFVAVLVPAVFIGRANHELLIPIACFMTTYMTSCAAKCGLIRSMFILISHSIVSAFGTAVLLFAATSFQTIAVATDRSPAPASGNTTEVRFETRGEPTAPGSGGLIPAKSASPPSFRPRHRAIEGTETNPFFQH